MTAQDLVAEEVSNAAQFAAGAAQRALDAAAAAEAAAEMATEAAAAASVANRPRGHHHHSPIVDSDEIIHHLESLPDRLLDLLEEGSSNSFVIENPTDTSETAVNSLDIELIGDYGEGDEIDDDSEQRLKMKKSKRSEIEDGNSNVSASSSSFFPSLWATFKRPFRNDTVSPVEKKISGFLVRLFVKPCLNCLPSCVVHPKLCLTPKGQMHLLRKYFCQASFHQERDPRSAVGSSMCGCYCIDDRHFRKLIKKDKTIPISDDYFYLHYLHYRPKWVGLFLPAIVWWVVWATLMFYFDNWHMFLDRPPKPESEWPENVANPSYDDTHYAVPGFAMTLVMLLGGSIAGASSEGGGSIAYPFMTLVFGLSSSAARDFSLMIQSIGMTGASFTNVYLRVTMEWNSIVWSTVGATCGLIFGLGLVEPNIPEDAIKLIFVSLFLAFTISLFLLNRVKNRKTHINMGRFDALWTWRRLSLLTIGFVGGIWCSFFGTGLDICQFAMLCLLFRITEKTATPTSVVLQAINSVVGFWYIVLISQQVNEVSWWYWWCASPVVVLAAPIGSIIGMYLHRQILAALVYTIDVVQFVAALIIIAPEDPLVSIATAFGALLVSLFVFGGFAMLGEILLAYEVNRKRVIRKIRKITVRLENAIQKRGAKDERENDEEAGEGATNAFCEKEVSEMDAVVS